VHELLDLEQAPIDFTPSGLTPPPPVTELTAAATRSTAPIASSTPPSGSSLTPSQAVLLSFRENAMTAPTRTKLKPVISQ